MDKSVRRFEYEEQFFDFSSKFFTESFKDYIKQDIESTLEKFGDSLKTKLRNQVKHPQEFNTKVNEMMKTLREKYKAGLDSVSDQMTEKVASCMNIPRHVLLLEDLPIRNVENVNSSDLEESIQNLHELLNGKTYMKAAILEEMKEADTTNDSLSNLADFQKIDLKVFPMKIPK